MQSRYTIASVLFVETAPKLNNQFLMFTAHCRSRYMKTQEALSTILSF